MVNQIPVPQAKYELLNQVGQNHWKNQVLRVALTLVVVGSLLVSVAWFDIIGGGNKSSESTNFTDKSDTNNIIIIEDAKIAPWLRRARMYAESAKENENADRNSTIPARKQYASRIATSQIVVCYYSIPGGLNPSWELDPSRIDPSICTHIIVGFASVVNSTISLGDASSIYERVTTLKYNEPKLKVMISVGGMNELRNGFPEMAKKHATRKQFIQSVLNVTKIMKLDGLDVDWEFPAWLGQDERQRIYFVQLLQELRKEFDRSGRKLLLSIAVAAPPDIVDQSYNVPQIAEHVDFVNLMAYDYHFYVWYYPVTGLNAPLYPTTGFANTFSVNYSANYWLAKGMPREKLIIGIPTYGHSYELDNPRNHDLLAPAKGFGKLGNFGFTSYYDACTFLANGAIRQYNRESRVPYAYKDSEWLSYDDRVSVLQKAEWIKAYGYGGAMIFSLNTDDWGSSCPNADNETFPLTRIVFSTLQGTRIKNVTRGL